MPTTIHGTNGITFNDGSTQNSRPAVGFRNRIINGDMRIDQRSSGASYAVTTGSAYGSCDRWGSLAGASGVWTQRRTATTLTDFPFAMRIQRTAGSTSTAACYIGQVIETTNCADLAGRSVTLSFEAIAGANFSAASSLIYAEVWTGTGSDQGWGALNSATWTGQTAIINSAQPITTTKTRYSSTAVVPAGVNEIAIRFYAVGVGTAGANDFFEITGFQLEAGSTATDFERRPIGTELALCQRYYDKSYSMNVAPGTNTLNGMVQGIMETYAGAWYQGGGSIRFTTEMRRAPDFNYRDYTGTLNRFTNFWTGSYGYNINPTVTLFVSTKAVSILETAGPSGGWSGSPLMCHYTADAEL